MLAADYAEKLACPFCGAPVRKMGRTYEEDGKILFAANGIICGERSKIPYKNSNRWSRVDVPRDKVVRGEVVGTESVERFQYIATHECVGEIMLGNCCTVGQLLQAEQCVSYRGEEYWWMAPATGFVEVGRIEL